MGDVGALRGLERGARGPSPLRRRRLRRHLDEHLGDPRLGRRVPPGRPARALDVGRRRARRRPSRPPRRRRGRTRRRVRRRLLRQRRARITRLALPAGAAQLGLERGAARSRPARHARRAPRPGHGRGGGGDHRRRPPVVGQLPPLPARDVRSNRAHLHGPRPARLRCGGRPAGGGRGRRPARQLPPRPRHPARRERPGGRHQPADRRLPEPGHQAGHGWEPDAEVGPQEYADLAASWWESGARIIGGCCGVTPAHLRAVRERLADAPALSAPA